MYLASLAASIRTFSFILRICFIEELQAYETDISDKDLNLSVGSFS